MNTNTTQPSPQHTPDSPEPISFELLQVSRLRFPVDLDTEELTDERTSLLQSMPLLVHDAGDHYVIIDGCKRFSHMKALGTTSCWCGIVPPPETATDFTLLRIQLNSNRTFTPYEKFLHVRKLSAHGADQDLLTIYQQLGIDKNDVSSFERLVRCSPEVIASFKAGTLDLHAAAEVERLDPPDRAAILALFGSLTFSRQMQKELVEWIPELAFRNRTAVTSLLNADWVIAILKSERLNAPQKIDKLRQTIYDYRFPTIARAKKTWSDTVTTINPAPQNIHFKPSEAFEKNRLEVKITVTSAEQARQLFTKLGEIPEIVWEQLIYPAQLYGK